MPDENKNRYQKDIDEYNKIVKEKINKLTPEQIHELLHVKKECPNPVHLLKGVPLGMFHCEICGTMVIAGIPHGPIDPPFDPNISVIAKDFYEQYPELLE